MMHDALGRLWLLFCLTFIVAASSLAQAEKSYVLDAEDVVTIAVLGHPTFSGDYIVPESGIILLPVAGELKVTGLSLTEVKDIVTARMKARLKEPEVAVNVKTPRPRRVYVYGEVRSPGMLSMTPGWRIQEALSAAGGLSAGVHAEEVEVVYEKKNGGRSAFNLSKILMAPLADQPTLEPGDVLRFQVEYLLQVFVTGAVKSPALYSLKQSQAGILEVITRAGGLSDGADMKSVRVIRSNGEELKVDLTGALLRGEAKGLPKLNTGDVVVVTQSVERVWVLGYVARPGAQLLPQNEVLTISQVISLSGGNLARGRMSKVGLIRMENGVETRTIYDVGRFLMKGDATQNPQIKPGDIVYVPETNKVDLPTVLGALGTLRLIFGIF